MTRSTTTVTTTRVRHIGVPMGRNRENGPHLADLRAFLADCEGLPDDVLVYISLGNLDEGGRRDVTFEVRYQHPDPDE